MIVHSTVATLLSEYAHQYPQQASRLHSTATLLNEPEVIHRKAMAGHFTASLMVFNEAKTHVLTIHHKHLGQRLCPGGHIDDDGDPFDAARREAEEEAGVPFDSTHPVTTWSHSPIVDIDAHPIPANPKKQEDTHMHHDLMYCVTLPDGIALNNVHDEGVSNVEWTPLDEWVAQSTRHQRIMQVLQDPRYQLAMDMSHSSPTQP